MDVGPYKVGIRQFDSSLVGIQEGPPPERMNSKPFIVKIVAFLHLQHNFKLLEESWQQQQVLMTVTRFLGC
jgi:hypothetical protein